MLNATDTQLPPDATRRLIHEMNSERADDVLLYAQIYGKQSTARQAEIISLERDHMDLEVKFSQGAPKRLSIRFSTPAENIEEAEKTLNHLIQKAHDTAGHNSREVVGRFISNYIRRWTG